MTKEEKEILVTLLNKAIESECFLIDKEVYFVHCNGWASSIDEDGDIVMKEVTE